MPKRTIKKPPKGQTVREFKAWLRGILEFQPSDWCPNSEQWKNIQEKISLLQDEIVRTETRQVVTGNPQMPVPNIDPQRPARLMDESPTERLAIITEPGKSALPITLLDENAVDPSLLGAVTNVSAKVIPTGKRYKTPSDLSGNEYKSPFT